jgi:hypothetical protein
MCLKVLGTAVWATAPKAKALATTRVNHPRNLLLIVLFIGSNGL